jgi:drug/metabolite transporter (DMT)-like permease|tara:strand:- start:761 stop:1048 length:288 start_codon:yes stop_codon:yes gene_type:complete
MYDKNTITNFNKSIKNTPISLMLGLVGIVILAFAARICFIDLVKEYEATTLIPNLRAGSTLLTIIIGYFLFKEQMSIFKLCGIILIFGGIYLLNN